MANPREFQRDHYAEVTNRIIAALEAGTRPWRRPWDPNKVGGGGPVNGVSGHRYRGVNTLLLSMTPPMVAAGDPRWMSFKQAQDKGWQVRKGEKASTIFFFKKVELKGAEGGTGMEDSKIIPVLRSYPVFHASQVDGRPEYAPPPAVEVPWRTPESAAVIVSLSGATVREGGDKAFYSPSADIIQMPPRAAFRSAEGWAGTIMHELGHWSGHPSRLDRDLTARFGSNAYAMEELRAELASAFIGAELGIPAEIEQHASYVDGWLKVLRQDKREVFRAAADAQRIADHLLAYHPLYAARLAAESETKSKETVETSRSEPTKAAREMPEHLKRTLNIVSFAGAPAAIIPNNAEEVTCAPSFRR